MFYKNTSIVTKKFHGIEFKPGDVKGCQEYINDPFMVRVSKPKEQPVKPAKASSAKSEPKPEQEAKPENASK